MNIIDAIKFALSILGIVAMVIIGLLGIMIIGILVMKLFGEIGVITLFIAAMFIISLLL